jgi:hypothetical protein
MTGSVFAHCDGMDGPVVNAAQKSLQTGNVNFVLIWVQPEDEEEIRSSFRKTLSVRKLSPEAKELADRYFFETVVRIHRAGEGAPYTGLKPAGRDLGPAIPAADKAIETGSAEQVQHLLQHGVEEGVDRHFKNVMARKNFDPDDVQAGREYVKEYVSFIHYVKHVHEATHQSAHGHFSEATDEHDRHSEGRSTTE